VPVHSVQRKLAAIFAADIAGYSRLMARDENGTLARLKACRVIIEGLIASHRGRIFNTAGDSVVADFAMHCASFTPRLGARCNGSRTRRGSASIDFHWYRKQKEGFWGHKPGATAARNVDNSNHVILNPQTCDRGPYTIFCEYFYTCRSQRIK
jgi:hypothetical protein